MFHVWFQNVTDHALKPCVWLQKGLTLRASPTSFRKEAWGGVVVFTLHVVRDGFVDLAQLCWRLCIAIDHDVAHLNTSEL
jgi:hypothetical protein